MKSETEKEIEQDKICIMNLPLGTTQEEVFSVFSKSGPVASVSMPKSNANKFEYCLGFVAFKDKETASKAIHQFSGYTFRNSIGNASNLALNYAFLREGDKKASPNETKAVISEGHRKPASPVYSINQERQSLLNEIKENDIKIQELKKAKAAKDEEEAVLDQKVKRLTEEAEWLPGKIDTLNQEIEVLSLKCELKKLKAQQQVIIHTKETNR